MNRNALLGLLLATSLTATLPAQSINQDAVKRALQRIAVANATVESVIFDGMRYTEVSEILGVELSVNIESHATHLERKRFYGSWNGKCIIYWNSPYIHENPTVIWIFNTQTGKDSFPFIYFAIDAGF